MDSEVVGVHQDATAFWHCEALKRIELTLLTIIIMALQKTKAGKVDKRTTEYKEMVANLEKARQAKAQKNGKKPGFLARLFGKK